LGCRMGLCLQQGWWWGFSAGVSQKEIVVLAAFVAVAVEATSMAAGQYSSEKAVHQMDKTGKHTDSLILGALIMFFSYLLAGLIPIVPVILFNQSDARILSIIFAFIGLFLVGYIKGKVVEHKPLRSAIELFIIGAVATSIGLLVGYFLKV